VSERSTIRYEQGEDGIVTLVLDDPDQSANTMNDAYVESMGAVLDRLEAEQDRVTGVIVTSAKKTFFAGGDLKGMIKATPADAGMLTERVNRIKAQFRRLETLGRPVVAAVNGSALGGGLEIALACHHRIALDAPGSKIGFPEVTLGLLPGAGGVTRTVRMLGIQDALMKVLLEGRQFRPQQALENGLVDEVVADADTMLAQARAWIGAHPDAVQPWDVKGFRIPGGTPSTPAFAQNLPAFPATLRKRLKGAPMPAPKAILAAAVEGAQVDVDTSCLIETRYLVSLLTGQVAKNMIQAFFFDLQQVTSGAVRPAAEPFTATRLGVVGAGMMGAGIAYQAARSGLPVVLRDVSDEAVQRGVGYSRRLVEKDVSRGRMSQPDGEALLGRITATTELADLAGCDAVIEAVFEDPALKRQVYAELAGVLAPGTLLASNTSTLPISGLAEGAAEPESFIGMHFFSPVEKMPLLEIVVGRRTSDATIARAFDLGKQIRKTTIVVNDSRGFFTSRVIGRFIDEAVGMVAEGVPAPSVEQAALQAGYPTGPLALADEVSLALMQRIRKAYAAAAEAEGQPFPGHPSHALVARMVDELGRPGRAGRAGFYDYDEAGRRGRLWSGLAELATDQGRAVPLAELQERMLFAEAVDSARCLEEGVLRSVPDANIGSIMGIGFPPWTGGVLQYIEGYPGGVAGFVARARELAARYGERFEPPASLLARAEPVPSPA
jgi:3-hydroxyacyl-CoA dehydrogenase / enoyl-CoA hydratase / 3-hydroxybutyryl-CoA epimerase